MHSNIELEFILLCATQRRNSQQQLRLHELLSNDLPWQTIIECSAHHHLIPLVFKTIHEQGASIDEDSLKILGNYLRANAQLSARLSIELVKVNELLENQQIKVITYKGPILSLLIYNDITYRPGSDIDLLVEPKQLNETENLLHSLGYETVTRDDSALQISLFHPNKSLAIDLHWGIPPGILKIKTSLLWADITTVTCLGRSINTFCRDDSLIVAAINAVKEYWNPSLHHLCDITMIARDFSDYDWFRVLVRANNLKCKRIVKAALLLCHQLLSLSLPEAFVKEWETDRAIACITKELSLQLRLIPKADSEVPTSLKPIHVAYHNDFYLMLMDSCYLRITSKLKQRLTKNIKKLHLIK